MVCPRTHLTTTWQMRKIWAWQGKHCNKINHACVHSKQFLVINILLDAEIEALYDATKLNILGHYKMFEEDNLHSFHRFSLTTNILPLKI